MNRKRKWEKEERREAITDVIRQNPCLTDEDLAKRFSVSAATIRLDRQMLGIPQMRKRIEKAVSEHPSGFHEELQILDMEKGKKGLALFHTTEEMTDRSGMVSADRLYAAAADFAQSLAGQVFTPVQIMTNGGPGYSTTTIVTYLYQKGFQEYKMGMASAIAVIMFVILLFLSILQNKATSER